MPYHIPSFWGLHGRFSEQNGILKEIVSSQKEMTDVLRRIDDKMDPHSQHDAAEDRQE